MVIILVIVTRQTQTGRVDLTRHLTEEYVRWTNMLIPEKDVFQIVVATFIPGSEAV